VSPGALAAFCVALPVVAALLVLVFRHQPNVREGATLLMGGATLYHVWALLHYVREHEESLRFSCPASSSPSTSSLWGCSSRWWPPSSGS
jgi:hypothetical protein